MKDDVISRQMAIDAMLALQTEDDKTYGCRIPESFNGDRAAEALKALPPALPEHSEGLYVDGYNDGYRGGMKESQIEPQWIPFKTRPLTEEEKEEHPEWGCILDCKLPDDGQQILVSVSVCGHERVQYDEFYTDDGSYLDSGYEIGTESRHGDPCPSRIKGLNVKTMIQITECTRQNLCIGCDDARCVHKERLMADCPKYYCDRKGELFEDCESCDFLKRFQKDMRAEYDS